MLDLTPPSLTRSNTSRRIATAIHQSELFISTFKTPDLKSGFSLMELLPIESRLCVEGDTFMNSTFTSTGQAGVAEVTKEMRDEIVDWLRDAYSMERGLETSLEKQSQDNDLDPA